MAFGVPPGGFHGLFYGYNGGSVYGALVKSLTYFKIFKLSKFESVPSSLRGAF
jgi:hypothetical protein